MKKSWIFIVIIAALLLMPAISAIPTATTKSTKKVDEEKTPKFSPEGADVDGYFVGGLGRVYKDGEEWITEPSAYIYGAYRDRSYKILIGNITNLDEEVVGHILMISNRFFLIGRITNLEGKKAPIVGFIIDFQEDKFIGRLMSLFGPAPHMWGQYYPNE